eukprot:CAMPEP_0181326032 /NCGR_PEP_ID=MMETSP1101-20121128/21263_1 /TAXON_ID=46948 /ORGANISM="Rhodomonas abbreviata, Strain Caron Lab Isolate" /LENGTH=136 /DNA_ID=CAMNT_0023434421 /DNA_START=12 /DNA_END=422 /DNA_ORIENTATION=-
MNISFPISTVWLRGENVDIIPESFDYVVGSHVLCSVDNVRQVLKQVKRALKPGGTYYFTEHIAAPTESPLRPWQELLEPVFNVVANGCKFKSLWLDLSEETGLPGFDVSVRFMDAPIPIPFLQPHLQGQAVKRRIV